MNRAIIIILALSMLVAGRATSKPPQWHQSLWRAQNPRDVTPEIGSLKSSGIEFNVILTEFKQTDFMQYYPYSPQVTPTYLAISITCRNRSNETLRLPTSPVQMINASQTLAREILFQRVMREVYRERTLNMLYSVSEADVEGVVSEFLEPHRGMRHSQLYMHNFTPVSLPVGVSTSWTQYYPYTPGPLRVLLRGDALSDGVSFMRVPGLNRPVNSLESYTPRTSPEIIAVGLVLGIVGAIYLLNQVN